MGTPMAFESQVETLALRFPPSLYDQTRLTSEL